MLTYLFFADPMDVEDDDLKAAKALSMGAGGSASAAAETAGIGG